MNHLIGITATAIAFVIAMAVIVNTFSDLERQRRITEGKKYRKELGIFSMNTYIKDRRYLKDYEWKKQKNDGIKPTEYSENFVYKNHGADLEFIVENKGM